MKKTIILLSILASMNAYAGSIDYLAQQDSEYFAHPAMTGKIGTSGAFYNPAGTAFMEDGTYIKINSQTIFKDYGMYTDYKGDPGKTDPVSGSHESSHPSALVPSVQFVKKDGNRSYFIHGGVAAGGGAVKYGNGISAFEIIGESIQAGFKEKNFKNTTVDYLGGSTVYGSSYYANINFGMAEKINSKFSVAGGLRFMSAIRELEGTANYDLDLGTGKGPHEVKVDINSERTAYGVGGVIGFNYKPTEKLNIGFKYETEVELYFKTKDGANGLKVSSPVYDKIPVTSSNASPSVSDAIDSSLRGHSVISEWLVNDRRNLPATMALGFAYDVNEKTTLLGNGNYYFIKDANRNGAYDGYDNGYELSIGVDYKLTDKYTLMAGYQFTDTGANENTFRDTDYALDADMYGVGISYSPNETKTFTLSYSLVDYKNGTSKETNTTFKKEVHAIGISAEFKY